MCTYFTLTVTLLSVKRLLLLHITAHYSGIYSPCLWTGSISFMRVRWCDIIPPWSGLAQRHEYPLKPAYGDGWGERGRGKKWACNPSPVASQNTAPSAQSDEHSFFGCRPVLVITCPEKSHQCFLLQKQARLKCQDNLLNRGDRLNCRTLTCRL